MLDPMALCGWLAKSVNQPEVYIMYVIGHKGIGKKGIFVSNCGVD
jgi:hypothetical protein